MIAFIERQLPYFVACVRWLINLYRIELAYWFFNKAFGMMPARGDHHDLLKAAVMADWSNAADKIVKQKPKFETFYPE